LECGRFAERGCSIITLKSQLLSKTVFRKAICDCWSLGIVLEKTVPKKPLAKLEFEWNSDGSLRAVHRLKSCLCCNTLFEPKQNEYAQYCCKRCKNRAYTRANSARLNKKRRDAYAKDPNARKRELDRCWRYYHLRGGREVRIRYKHFYTMNRFSLPTGFPLNLSVCVVNGQERIVDAIRLEKAVKHGWKNSSFNCLEMRKMKSEVVNFGC